MLTRGDGLAEERRVLVARQADEVVDEPDLAVGVLLLVVGEALERALLPELVRREGASVYPETYV